MTLTYRAGVGEGATVNLGDVVFLGEMPGFTERADGTVGMSGVTIQDPGGTLNLTGLGRFEVEESACTSNVRIFTGISADRGISRGEYTTGAGRVWETNLADLNAYLHLRIIRDGNHGNRPAETETQRITWLLDKVLTGHVRNGTGGLFGANGPTAAVIAAPKNLDAADYRNQHADDVLTDILPRGNRRFFCYWDPTLAAVCLFFGALGDDLGTSTLRISNVAADADSVTFAPFQDAALTRDPADVFGGILYTYRNGTIYREDPDTIAAFLDRSVAAGNDRVGRTTTASALVDTQLARASTERDTVTCTFRVPRAQVNLVVAGQRIQIKFSHLPGLTSFTSRYVVSRTVWQEVANAEFYYVTLELSDKVGGGLSGGGGGGGPFVPGAGPIAFVRKQHTYGATSPWTFTPTVAPAAGNLLVIAAHTRGAADKLLAITGWTIVESALSSPANGGNTGVGMSMFYRVAQAGDTAWTINATQCDISYSEWSGAGALLTSASATVAAAGSTSATVLCGGAVTPVASSPVLVLGSMSAAMENDTATMSTAPDSGVTELNDWADAPSPGGNPGRWSAYRITPAAPSGSYTISGVAAVSAAGISQAGITAVFGSGIAFTPTHGQTVTESATGVTAGTTLTTRYAYYPRSLRVTVGGVAVVPTETDPAAGTFTLPIDSTGSVVVVTYQAADGTLTASTNVATPVATAPVVPAEALTAHTGDASDAHDASAISFVPTSTVAATDVQAAIAEVASEASVVYEPVATGASPNFEPVYTADGRFVMAPVGD